MAIIQARVIALINAGLDYQQALIQAVDNIKSAVQSVKSGLNTAESALQEIELINTPESLLHDPAGSPATLTIEHYHFARNARKNINERNKASAKRRSPYPYQLHTNPFATERLAQPIPFRQPQQNRKGAFPGRPSSSSPSGSPQTYTMADVDEEIRRINKLEEERLAEIERQRAIGNLPLSEQDAADDLADSTLDLSNLSDNEEPPK